MSTAIGKVHPFESYHIEASVSPLPPATTWQPCVPQSGYFRFYVPVIRLDSRQAVLGWCRTWTLLCLKWFPNQQGTVEAWVKRFRFLCYLCSCLGFQTALEPLRKMDLQDGDDAVASKRCVIKLHRWKDRRSF